jgi:predicted O-methyltransferase YrrM
MYKKMLNLLNYVLTNAEDNNPLSVIQSIENFFNIYDSESYTQNIIKNIKLYNPKNLLEIDSSFGYYTILCLMNMDKNSMIYTIYNDDYIVRNITKYFIKKAGYENRVIFITSNYDTLSILHKWYPNLLFDYVLINRENNDNYSNLLYLINRSQLIKNDTVFYINNIMIQYNTNAIML